jgi:hypothetical protein
MPAQTSLSPEALCSLVGRPEAPAVIDVRIDEDHALDPRMLPGSWRRDVRSVPNSRTHARTPGMGRFGCQTIPQRPMLRRQQSRSERCQARRRP